MENLNKAFKIPELKSKILFTLLILTCVCLGSLIPIPAASNSEFISIAKNWGDVGVLLDVTSVGGLYNGAVTALGIYPFLVASILMQILTLAVPFLRNKAQEGETGAKYISKITRIVSIVMCVGMAVLLCLGMKSTLTTKINFWAAAAIFTVSTAVGAALMSWACELINTKGMGNGITLILFAGCARLAPSAFAALYTKAAAKFGAGVAVLFVVLAVLICAVLVFTLVYVNLGERKVRILFRKMTSGMKQYGVPSQLLPVHVTQAGSMPVVYSLTICCLPALIVAMVNPNTESAGILSFINLSRNLSFFVFFVLFLIVFTYVFAMIQFNPLEMSNQIRQYGGYIQGVKAGKPTTEYLLKMYSNMIFMGSSYLVIMCCVPMLLSLIPHMGMLWFAGMSIVLLVGAVVETLAIIDNGIKTEEDRAKQANKRTKSPKNYNKGGMR